jgi:SAM-dependent methyltransferase
MTNFTQEDIKAFNDDVEAFFVEINEQKKRVQEDLKTVELPLLNGRICDFGCGPGYTTYCLASILNVTESIGIDIDPFEIRKAMLWFEAVKLYKQRATKEELSENAITQETNRALGIIRHPEFLVGDISLVYCRKLRIFSKNGGGVSQPHDQPSLSSQARFVTRMDIGGIWFVPETRSRI